MPPAAIGRLPTGLPSPTPPPGRPPRAQPLRTPRPMTRNAFVDESQRKDLDAVAALAVPHANVAATRQAVTRSLAVPGRVRRHFVREPDTARRTMLAAFAALPDVAVLVVTTPGLGRVIDQRARCLAFLAAALVEDGLSHLTLDHIDPTQAARDRHALYPALAAVGAEYHHEPEHSTEPLLWVPDAVAWCVGAGIGGCS